MPNCRETVPSYGTPSTAKNMVARLFTVILTKTRENIPNMPNGHKLYQMSVKHIYQITLKYANLLLFKPRKKIPKLRFFGLKINHLATLIET
jgi:hypothetical protein